MQHPAEDRLQDYLDDLLCREERAELEAHLGACAECTRAIRTDRGLRRALAALPRAIQPERDLLAAINAAIDAGAAGHAAGDQRGPWLQRPLRALAAPLAAAAVLLVVLTATLTLLLSRDDATPLPTADAGVQDPMVRQVLAAEPSFNAAAAELEAVLESGRGLLDPGTVRLLEASLHVIDDAVAEARAALADDPNNAALAQLLHAAYEQKLALLRHATRASLGT
jgi:anti-sigma factor RsiW